jgi:hypothetical protein
MKVKIIKDYNDLQLKRLVTVKNDKELDVTAERGAELIKAGVAEEIKAETPAAETPEKKPTRKKKEASK